MIKRLVTFIHKAGFCKWKSESSWHTKGGSALTAGEWNSWGCPGAHTGKTKISKWKQQWRRIEFLVISSGGGNANSLLGKEAHTSLPGRTWMTWCQSLEGQKGGGDHVFLTTNLEDVSKHWLTIHVAIDQTIAYRKPMTMLFFFNCQITLDKI